MSDPLPTLPTVPLPTGPSAGDAVNSAHLRWAVVDGPHGVTVVATPGQRGEALVLRDGHHFWCSTRAGGCGGQLTLAAGEIVRPHFRHLADPGGCALANDPATAQRTYEHLRLQQALAAWLSSQGLHPSLEHSLGWAGRADLHVLVDGVAQGVEVQLSPISDQSWRERDTSYRTQVQHVSWLYGAGAEPAAAREVALRGVALRIRWVEDPSSLAGDPVNPRRPMDLPGRTDLNNRVDLVGHAAPSAAPGEGVAVSMVQIGVQTHVGGLEGRVADAVAGADEPRVPPGLGGRGGSVQWYPLQECRLTAEGFWTPHVPPAEDALHPLPAQPAADHPGEDPGPGPTPGRSGPRTAGPPSAHAVRSGSYPGSLANWRRTHPEASDWIGQQGEKWLQASAAPQRAALHFLGYLTQRIYAAGPLDMFDLPDLPDAEAILTQLEQAKLIVQYSRGGVRRWERAAPGSSRTRDEADGRG